ncbi:hypothetical protein MMC21_007476 [Puttea exsequens]|nr:hypothetical protein [Puttea exsequens]
MSSLPSQSPPTPTSYILATAILCLSLGYFIGQGHSLGLFSSSFSSSKQPRKNSKSSWPNNYDVAIHPDSSDEDLMDHVRREGLKIVCDSEDEESDGYDGDGDGNGDAGAEMNSFENSREECKLVLVVRTDLGMGKGKIAAQCSHATLACYTTLLHVSSPIIKRWIHSGQPKIALQVPTEDLLDELHAKALSVGLCARVVHDAGRTQVASGSKTVLGLGPGPKSVVDGVTGGLRLL